MGTDILYINTLLQGKPQIKVFISVTFTLYFWSHETANQQNIKHNSFTISMCTEKIIAVIGLNYSVSMK